MDLAREVLSGSRLALARLLTQVENETPEGRRALNSLFAHTGRAFLIGVTGSPGAGKSSLVGRLAKALRGAGGAQDPRVGIIAIDPTSPFSGGALLGDRVRMRELAGDPGIFIRSMASRGALGGLARATEAVVQAMDAAGYGVILIETVGAGQSEVDIARLAHTVVVVEAPGLGDDIQAIKAGILEIADILVVNKGDLPGAEQAVRVLRNMLEMAHPAHAEGGVPAWEPPVLKTSATLNEGISEVLEAVQRHRAYLHAGGEFQRRERERLQNGLEALLQAALVERWKASVSPAVFEDVLARLSSRKLSPYQAVEELLQSGASQ